MPSRSSHDELAHNRTSSAASLTGNNNRQSTHEPSRHGNDMPYLIDCLPASVALQSLLRGLIRDEHARGPSFADLEFTRMLLSGWLVYLPFDSMNSSGVIDCVIITEP